jgi:hypothetical protein
MKNLSSTLRRAALVLWHVALFIMGIALLAIWLAALWLERAIGTVLPRFVAALPEKYHPPLINVAAFSVNEGSKDKR